MKPESFDYHLPEDLIAQYPVEARDTSRLMVVHRDTGKIEHRTFQNILDYLRPEDGLVLNRTRVLPVRLRGIRAETGGQVEVVLIRETSSGLWEALLRPAKRLVCGSKLSLEDGSLQVEVSTGPDQDKKYVRFPDGLDVAEVLQRVGRVPLPPYIRRDPEDADRIRYQTVYADTPGAVAVPTAGLHFTNDLLDKIQARHIARIPILLHVGPGTFQPIRVDSIEKHTIEAEYYKVEEDAMRQIMSAHRSGRVVAVGTTSVRVLETIGADQMDNDLAVQAYEGWTSQFIYPPYSFRLVDVLLTNFHLPQSTLLMLVCAFADRQLILRAYEEAVQEKYRFYSYGDAMMIL